jgi:S1-C subfamily serine protease
MKTMDKLNEYKKTKKVGDEIKLKISRDGKEMELTITLSEAP